MTEKQTMTEHERSVYSKLTSLTAKLQLIAMLAAIVIITLLIFVFPYYEIDNMKASDSLFFVAAVLLCYRIIRTATITRRDIALDKKQDTVIEVKGKISRTTEGLFDKRSYFKIEDTKYLVLPADFDKYQDGTTVKMHVTPRVLAAVFIRRAGN